MATKTTDPEASTFQRKPAYRYIRTSDALPTVDAALADPTPIARVKLFDPTGSLTWYIAGYNPETRVAWGLVGDGFEREIGDIYMPEIVDYRAGRGSDPHTYTVYAGDPETGHHVRQNCWHCVNYPGHGFMACPCDPLPLNVDAAIRARVGAALGGDPTAQSEEARP